MGQEILYCFKCQERVTSADMDSSNALRFGNRVACKKCVPDLIASLSPKEQQELVARVRDPIPQDRRLSSGHTPRPRPAAGTRRKTQAIPMPWWAFAAGGGALLLGIVFVVLSSSSGPDPNRDARQGPGRIPPQVPEESPRERAAREALAKAKIVPSSNLEGQIAAYADALRITEGTSHHREAKEMHEGLLDLRRKALVRELSVVEERARVTFQKEEFGAAVAIFEAIRPLHSGPEWKSLVDAKVEEVRKTIDATYGPLKEQAAAARRKGAEDEVKAIRDRVSRWGLADKTADLEAGLPPVVPVVVPVAARTWIPLFDGTSLDFLTGGGEGAYRVENGTIVFVKGQNSAAQTRRQFSDGEIRVRFQHRDLTDLGFCVRQGALGVYTTGWDRQQLRNLEGIDHEVLLVFRGSDVSATLDGKPLPIEASGKPLKGHFQFKARGEMFVIKLLEYREDPSPEGLVAHWTFDALQGDKVPDATANKNDGKLVDGPSGVAGRIGNALQFGPGKRSFVSVPSSPSLGLTGPLTIAAWVKPSTTEGAPGIVEMWDSIEGPRHNGYFLRLSSRGHVLFVIPEPGGKGEVTGQRPIPVDAWTHVAGVYDGSIVRVFVNGIPDRSAPAPQVPRVTSNPLVIGRAGGGGGHYFAGSIDDIRIYNRALSADDIAGLAAMAR